MKSGGTGGQTDRCDDCEVWQVAATGTGVVTQNDITVSQAVSQRFDLCIEAQTHLVRLDSFIFLAEPPHKHLSPGTAPSPAWPPGAQGCAAHWRPTRRQVQTRRRRSQVAP